MVLSVALGAGIAFLLRTGDSRPLDARRPRHELGSPAQVWLERGEQLSSEINERIGEQPGWAPVSTGIDGVVTDLAEAAERVTVLNRLLDADDVQQLGGEHDRLEQQLEGAPPQARPELRSARNAVAERLHLARRRSGARDTLLARIRTTVIDLELCRDEVDTLTEQAEEPPAATGEPADKLAERLAELRRELAEVAEMPEIRQLSDPGQDSSSRASGPRNPLPGDPE